MSPPPPAGDDWYLCRLTLTTHSQTNLPWAMFPSPYLAAVGPDSAPGSVVYHLLARQQDGTVGDVQYFLLEGESITCGFSSSFLPFSSSSSSSSPSSFSSSSSSFCCCSSFLPPLPLFFLLLPLLCLFRFLPLPRLPSSVSYLPSGSVICSVCWRRSSFINKM